MNSKYRVLAIIIEASLHLLCQLPVTSTSKPAESSRSDRGNFLLEFLLANNQHRTNRQPLFPTQVCNNERIRIGRDKKTIFPLKSSSFMPMQTRSMRMKLINVMFRFAASEESLDRTASSVKCPNYRRGNYSCDSCLPDPGGCYCSENMLFQCKKCGQRLSIVGL